jgi:hypothetical protein
MSYYRLLGAFRTCSSRFASASSMRSGVSAMKNHEMIARRFSTKFGSSSD